MAGRRKYRVGDHPEYDRVFDIKNMESPILNPKATSIMNATTVDQMNSREGLNILLSEWRGDDSGFWNNGGVKVPSKLKIAELAIKNIQLSFETRQQRQVNSGRAVSKKMPPDMLDELHRAEAVVDIHLSEIAALEKRLSELVAVSDQSSKTKVLERGPGGSGQMKGGVLVLLDGQIIKQNSDGVLIIDDERSPYHGMETADYFEHIVKPWSAARDKLYTELCAKARIAVLAGAAPGSQITRALPPNPEWPENVKKVTLKKEIVK